MGPWNTEEVFLLTTYFSVFWHHCLGYSKDIQPTCATYPEKFSSRTVGRRQPMELVNPGSHEEWLLKRRRGGDILANNAQRLYENQQPESPWQPGACVT